MDKIILSREQLIGLHNLGVRGDIKQVGSFIYCKPSVTKEKFYKLLKIIDKKLRR
jgi:hypothetical protein